jgi:predicted HicB family RNase H-like nuclease
MNRQGQPVYKITGPEMDLEAEVILDSKGRRVDQAYVDRALADVEEDLARRAGRPSLTGKSEHSPHVSFRITPELKARAEQTAREQGTTVSQLAREAFERFLAS